jgi:hypothetical protein
VCGRYEAGLKQKIAEAFHVSVMLDDVYFSPDTEAAPGSIQPVIYMRDGRREIGEMRWGFKLPDRLLFNARSEGIQSPRIARSAPTASRPDLCEVKLRPAAQSVRLNVEKLTKHDVICRPLPNLLPTTDDRGNSEMVNGAAVNNC